MKVEDLFANWPKHEEVRSKTKMLKKRRSTKGEGTKSVTDNEPTPGHNAITGPFK